MLPARTYSVTINHDWRALYETIWRPEFFPKWASGLAESELRKDGEHWSADGPEGPLRIRFTPHNLYGVMDHHVDLGDGTEVYVPLRVVENGDGAEVMLTLFRQPRTVRSRHQAGQPRPQGTEEPDRAANCLGWSRVPTDILRS